MKMCDIQQTSILESKDQKAEETEGFDLQAGLSWIYPTNYPLRDYQFNIIQQALFKNTLVSLPTGLGKTFIAAVVMYNFYRWYPTGKIIFMAPTKPLVKQQVDACYNIMAIPQNVTAELTGVKQNSTRNNIWTEKRVFFVTPQVLQNDLDSFPDLGFTIKCIVFDEAHKAKGNYAYCEVIRKLKRQTKYFRVLALSATPGNGIDDIGEVITNLMITHLEFRTEESPDVKPYVFNRKLETIVVPLGEKLEQVKMEFSEILEKYARTLIKYQVIQGNYSTLTKGRIYMAKAEFQARSVRPPHHNEILKNLNVCMSLYHAFELLIRHGLRGFLSFLDQHTNHPLLRGITSLINIREEVRDYLGPLPNVEQMPDGNYPEVPLNVKFGHPKHYKLRDILISHFSSSEENSKVIVFFEYRDSVMESFVLLLQARPLIRAKIFLGQKSGITQRVQLHVIKSFRDGDCNTLLSTCIGEEGLDVGEVDLIVCFDVSTKSPIRMIQRMGRTGRKREGQVAILVTEGKEQQTLNDCLIHKNNMKKWAGSSMLMERFFVRSSRMVPKNIDPECIKMQITVQKPVLTKKSTLKDMLRTISSSSSSSLAFSEDVEIIEIEEKIPNATVLFNKSLSDIVDINFEPVYNKHIENQRSLQGGAKIKSSDASNLFVSLMKFADSRRFNIPLTQDVDKEFHNKRLKQGDIRSMLTKALNKIDITPSQEDFATQKIQPSTSSRTQSTISTQYSREDPKLEELHADLHLEIANYLFIELTMDNGCEICNRLFKCSIHDIQYDDKYLEDLRHWITPDFSKIEGINLDDLELYEKMMCSEPEFEENDFENSILELLDEKDISNLFAGSNMDKEKLKDKFTFDAPKSFNNLLDTFNISSTYPIKEQNTVEKIDDNSIMAETRKSNDILSFFKLERIEDIYELENEILDNSHESDKTIICSNQESKSPQDIFENYQLSPVLGIQNSPSRHSTEAVEPDSPVLKPCEKIQLLKDKSKVRRSLDIIDTSIEENTNFPTRKFLSTQLMRHKFQRNISCSSAKTASENCDQLNDSKEDSDDDNLLGYFGTKGKLKSSTKPQKDADSLNIRDLCDLSSFGLTGEGELNQVQIENSIVGVQKPKSHIHSPELWKADHSSDMSVLTSAETTMIENDRKKVVLEVKPSRVKKTDPHQVDKPQKSEINNSNMGIDDFCDLSVFGLTENDEEADLQNNIQNQKNSPVYKTQLSNSKDSKTNTIEFDCFLKDLNIERMSTQREFHEKRFDKNFKSTNLKSTVQKSESVKSVEPKSDKIVETVIIEDSPIKGDVVDLTLSPKRGKITPKRKVLSQLSITQIISLAAKPTQLRPSLLNTQINPTLDKTNLDLSSLDISENFETFSSKFHEAKSGNCKTNKKETALHKSNLDLSRKDIDENFDTFSNKFDKSKSENCKLDNKEETKKNKVTPKKSVLISKSQTTSQCNKKEVTQTSSLMDDLDNFEEFNESFSIRHSSPVFKKPEVKKFKSERIRTDPKKSNSEIKSTPSCSSSSNTKRENSANISVFNSTKTSRTVLRNDSDDEFETTVYPIKILPKNVPSKNRHVKRPEKKINKPSKKQCDFIEQEAEVSSDALYVSDDESSEDGSFDESFVDDGTQNMINDTQMHAKYIQSVKSPANIRKFKIPAHIKPVTSEIFSQVDDPEEQNSYVNDSFCVNTQDIDAESRDQSHLEIMENILKERRRNKRKASRSDNNKNTKRKRIIISDSDTE